MLKSSPICVGFTNDDHCIVALLSGLEVCVWNSAKGTPLCQWEFCPFDEEAFENSVWKSGFLALNSSHNAAIVSDSAGNTCTFALLAISPAKEETEHYFTL